MEESEEISRLRQVIVQRKEALERAVLLRQQLSTRSAQVAAASATEAAEIARRLEALEAGRAKFRERGVALAEGLTAEHEEVEAQRWRREQLRELLDSLPGRSGPPASEEALRKDYSHRRVNDEALRKDGVGRWLDDQTPRKDDGCGRRLDDEAPRHGDDDEGGSSSQAAREALTAFAEESVSMFLEGFERHVSERLTAQEAVLRKWCDVLARCVEESRSKSRSNREVSARLAEVRAFLCAFAEASRQAELWERSSDLADNAGGHALVCKRFDDLRAAVGLWRSSIGRQGVAHQA